MHMPGDIGEILTEPFSQLAHAASSASAVTDAAAAGEVAALLLGAIDSGAPEISGKVIAGQAEEQLMLLSHAHFRALMADGLIGPRGAPSDPGGGGEG